MMRRGLLAIVVGLACGLAACGGGGGGDDEQSDTLTVTFEYPQTVNVLLFDTIDIEPTLSGLGGRSATVTVTDLASGSAPAGLTVDASTGAIHGTALKVGQMLLGANLTVSGVEGNVTTSFDVVVRTDVDVAYPTTAQTVFAGDALPTMTPTLSGILPTDVLVFSGSASMPPPAGITIDPASGVISGTPTVGAGTYVVPVVLTITRGTHTAELVFSGITFVVK